jgi:positive phototaxis protein PixI
MLEIADSLPTSSIASLESLLNPPQPAKPQQKFLQFRLGKEHPALAPVEDVLAVLTIAVSEVLPVPQMSACVLGIYNWRGEALWLVDASTQMGFSPWVDSRVKALTLIVAQSEGQSLGLVVPEVFDIGEHDPELLIPASADLFSNRMLPFVKGYFSSDVDSESVREQSIVINISALIQDSNLQVHRPHQL